MTSPFLRQSWRAPCAACCLCFFFSLALAAETVQERTATPAPAQSSAKESREQGPPQRIPRQQAQSMAALDGLVRDTSSPGSALPIPAAEVTLRNLQSARAFTTTSSAEGLFRLFPIPP